MRNEELLAGDPSETPLCLHDCHWPYEAALAQIAADELALDVNDRVEFADTARAVYGNGTFASRSAVLCGGATQRAAPCIREKLQSIVAHALETSPDDIEVMEGRAFVRGAPERGHKLREVARWTYHQQQLLPAGEEPGLVQETPPVVLRSANYGNLMPRSDAV